MDLVPEANLSLSWHDDLDGPALDLRMERPAKLRPLPAAESRHEVNKELVVDGGTVVVTPPTSGLLLPPGG